MRFTAEQVKQAMLADDRDVREAVAYYFARSFSDDPGIMPLAIEVLQRHRWNEAFETFSFLQDLRQTDETVLWLIDQIRNYGRGSDEDQDRYVYSLTRALTHADVSALERHASQILDLEAVDERSKDRICQRVRISTQPPEDLWHQLTEFCRRSDALSETPKDLHLANDLAQALGSHPDFTATRTLAILNGETGDKDNWIELLAVRLAAELKLSEVVSPIVNLLKTADDWIFEEGERALIKIAGNEVVEALARTYPSSEFGFKIAAAAILENIHTDLSVETALRLFEEEEDDDGRGRLLQSALMNFCTDAIEPARRFILTTPPTPDLLEVRRDLMVACKVMGERFPEFDKWVEESKHDAEFRRNWYHRNPVMPNLLDYDKEENDFDEEPLPPPETIIREVRVGRNDPCPCGSGKKFKKCCLGKRSSV